MNNVFCVTSYNSVGCTFIDWSVYFLSNQSQYYNVKSSRWLPLSQNPLTGLNSHGHEKNHPQGYDTTKHFIEHIESLSSNQLHSIYPWALLPGAVADYLNLSPESIGDPDTLKRITQFKKDDYNELLNFCHTKQIKTVFVQADPGSILYYQKKRVLTYLLLDYKTVATNIQQLNDEFQTVFFNNSIADWQSRGLTETWDVRERLALDTRPFDQDLIDFVPDLQHPHLWINSLDLWTRTPDILEKIMKFLELPIDCEKFNQWLPICSKWQKIQLDILEFCFNQEHIVNAIINNWHYEIDLTFDQEVIIQHCLIYQHGLNLKTWQLEKFPKNTKDLHKLLEPNIHPIVL
jgi:hypothetical protein